MLDPLAEFETAVAAFTSSTSASLKTLAGLVLAVQEDHAKTREQLYALTQRVSELEQRDRTRRGIRG